MVAVSEVSGQGAMQPLSSLLLLLELPTGGEALLLLLAGTGAVMSQCAEPVRGGEEDVGVLKLICDLVLSQMIRQHHNFFQ